MTNEEPKKNTEAAAPVSEEKLQDVSGGRAIRGYAPGDPCPTCGTPVVAYRECQEIGHYDSKCPNCGLILHYWY